MQVKSLFQPVARSSRIFMTTFLILLVVAFVQTVIVEIIPLLWTHDSAPAAPAPTEEPTAEEQTIQRILRARKEFLPDGTLHLVTEKDVRGLRVAGQLYDAPAEVIEIYDINNTRLWAGPPTESPYHYLSWARNTQRDSFTPPSMNLVRQIAPDGSRMLQIPVATEDRLMEAWRYDVWAGCFVGYALQDSRIGYLSAAGLTDSKSDIESFGTFQSFLSWWPLDSYSPRLLWQTDRHIYQIDFESRQVDLVLDSPDSTIVRIEISRWENYQSRITSGVTEGRSMLDAVTADNTHHLVLKDPDQTVKVTIPDEWQQWIFNQVEFAATDDALFMRRIWTEYPQPSERTDPNWRAAYLEATKWQQVELYRIDASGNRELVNQYRWILAAQPVEKVRYATFNIPPCATAFSPMTYNLVWSYLLATYEGNPFGASDWTREFAQFVSTVRPGCSVWAWLATAAMITLTFLHIRARSTSWVRIIFWLVLVGLFNSVGALSYWSLHHTPAIRCRACGRRRGLETPSCPRCQAPLPTPERGPRDLVFAIE